MKKINLRKVSDILSDEQLKKVIGSGYDGTGPGTPCYSATGMCHSYCVMVVEGYGPVGGTCQVLFGNMCGCVG